jgi:stage II sporulation protein M
MITNLIKIKKYFLFSFVVFLFSFVCGVFFVVFFPDLSLKALQELENSFKGLLEMSATQLGFFIFLNNSLKIFLFIILGVLFAVPTVFFLVVNGWVLGWVITATGFGSFFQIIPHGVFEFTALFIGSSLGIRLGALCYKNAKRKEVGQEKIKKELISSVKIFFLIIIPLLATAAIVETFLIFK